MNKTGNFQLIVLIVFIVGAVFGILVFSGLINIGNKSSTVVQGSAVLWGTVKFTSIAPALETFSLANPTLNVQYVEKNPLTFDQELLEALAEGKGPDMFILPDDLIVHYRNKIMPIPFASFPEASFRSSFAGAGEIYLNSTGVLALPLAIDPLVLYYSRSAFDAAGIINPPVYWNDMQNIVSLLTQKNQDGKIVKSAVALGQFSNILHAKDIISMLFMQAGSPIVILNGDSLSSALTDSNLSTQAVDLGPILSFYTSFADPLSALYSWNRSLANSRDSFSADKLALYFGYGSELGLITAKNPNQNFYIAPVPQIKNSNFKLTFGHTYGIAISAYTKNQAVAFTVAGLLANGDFAKDFANALLIAPARRDLLATKPTDAYFPVFYDSALFARSWLDPAPAETDAIFQRMVENVLSNNLSAENSIGDAASKLQLLLTK